MANVADYNVANASGASVRSDINNILQAVVTLNSGTSEPSTMYPFMIWVDTNTNLVKMRNGANDAWLTMPFAMNASNTAPGGLTVSGGDLTVDTSTLKVDSTNNLVAIGTASPNSYNSNTNNFVIRDSGNGGMTISTGASNTGYVAFNDGEDTTIEGLIAYNQSNDVMSFRTAGTDDRLVIDGSGKVGIGTASPATLLTITDNDDGTMNEMIRLVNDPGGSTAVGTGAYIAFANHHSGTEVSSIRSIAETTGAGTGLQFYTHSGSSLSEKVRINKDGSVGIGNTLGSFHSSVLPLIVGSGSGDEGMAIFSGSSSKGKIGFADAASDDSGSYRGYFQYDHSGDNLNIGTAGSERMRITSDGKVFIGDSTFGGTAAIHAVQVPASGAGCLIRVNSAAAANETMLQFQDAASQALGSITSNPSANTTAYNTSSDGRLKDITGEAKGLEIINALNPVAFTWKSSGVKAEGLIAQEVEKLVDHAVSKTKESEYLQMDYSKLVTPLIKAVQEQQEQIEKLKQEINEIRGN